MDLIKEINDRYHALEVEVDRKLELVKQDEERLAKMIEEAKYNAARETDIKPLSYEEAINRNANILKSLDIAKARLRSRTTFSPVDEILETAIGNYKQSVVESSMIAKNTSKTNLQAQTPEV